MDLRTYYNKTYQGLERPEQIHPSESLVEFLEFISEKFSFKDLPPRKTLVLGSGLGALLPSFLKHCCWPTCLDFSESAVKVAEKNHGQGPVEFICENLISFCRPKEFEFIFDSHLFHCLTVPEERKKSYSNVFESLESGGLFALECMVRTKETTVERDFFLDEQGVFWQVLDETVVPTRKINTALETENEILDSGFQIEYLMVHSEKKIIPHSRRSEVLPTDPEIMRIIARKP